MNTMTRKFLPLGTVVLFMAFFLTGCDAVLETFYPELTDKGGKFVTKSVNLELSYDKSLKGPIVVALVPYDDQNGYMVPADKSRWNIKRDTSKSGSFKVSLALDGFKTYKLIAFNNDPAGLQYDAVDKPNKDQSESMVISIGYSWDGKFTADDVEKDKYSQYLGKFGSIDLGTYNELFPSSTGSSIWLTMPKDFNTSTTLDQFKLSRVYDFKGMSQISEITVQINKWNGSNYAYDAQRVIAVSSADQFNTDIPFFANGNPYTFLTTGDYELQVTYKEDNTYTTTPQSFYFYIGAANGYAASAPLELSVTLDWSYTAATQGYLYYTDGTNWYYVGYVADTDTTAISWNVPYLPGGHLYLDALDSSGNWLTSYTSENDSSVQTPLQGVPSTYNGTDAYSISWYPGYI